MSRKRNPNLFGRSVFLHPEVHLEIAKEALERGQPIQERVHELLCKALGRRDLIERGFVRSKMPQNAEG